MRQKFFGGKTFLKIWWRSLSATRQAAVKQVGAALFISLSATVVSYFLFYAFSGEEFAIGPARFLSFIDSVLAGIVAFAMLGIFSFLASIRKPEEEEIDQRISFLYSTRRQAGDEFSDYLKEQIISLGAVVSKARFNYTVVDVSSDGSRFRVVALVEMTLVNMMGRDTYSQNTKLVIRLSKVPGLDGALGAVCYIKTTPMLVNGSWGTAASHLENPVVLYNHSEVFETALPINIPPNGGMRYEYMYDFWFSGEESHKCGARRFMEEASVTIRNNVSSPLRISPDCSDEAKFVTISPDKSCVLVSGEHAEFVFRSVPPSQSTAVVLSIARKPEAEDITRAGLNPGAE